MTVETASTNRPSVNQTLPFKWDADFPGENGSAIYELDLPASNIYSDNLPHQLLAIYIPKIGNQIEIWLNNELLDRRGFGDSTLLDTSQMPLFVSVPRHWLQPNKVNQLKIKTTVQALRKGGLSEVYFGASDELNSRYTRTNFWQQKTYIVILVSLLLMGLISWLLWWRMRSYESSKLYLYFVYSALAGCLSTLDHLIVQHLIPWPLVGIVSAVALAWHIIFMARFALELVGRQENWVSLAMLATTVAIGVAYVLAEPIYETITSGLLCLPLAAVLFCSAQTADASRSGPARAFFLITLLVAMAALRDFFVVHWPTSGMSEFVILPQTLFLFVLVMGWILVGRYTRQHRLYHDLNLHLESRVALKEQELAESFAALQRKGQEQARLLERQRIMQDIHDGVGGHLVGLVNMAKRSHSMGTGLDTKQWSEHAQLALDELRIAVDAMQPVDGDLATVLATLRYRLEPRLKSAGISLVWAVQDLPHMMDLTPQKVIQIQKILLEAMTNVMLHAKAKTVTLSASPLQESSTEPFIEIRLTDDGIGFDPDTLKSAGHGLANMKFRAKALGAQIRFTRCLPQGMQLNLQIPIQSSSTAR